MNDTNSVPVIVRFSKGRKEALEELVKEGEFRSIAEAINTAVTILLDRYGKLRKPGMQIAPSSDACPRAEVEG